MRLNGFFFVEAIATLLLYSYPSARSCGKPLLRKSLCNLLIKSFIFILPFPHKRGLKPPNCYVFQHLGERPQGSVYKAVGGYHDLEVKSQGIEFLAQLQTNFEFIKNKRDNTCNKNSCFEPTLITKKTCPGSSVKISLLLWFYWPKGMFQKDIIRKLSVMDILWMTLLRTLPKGRLW